MKMHYGDKSGVQFRDSSKPRGFVRSGHHSQPEDGIGHQAASRSEAELGWLRRFVPSVVREAVSNDPLHPPLCPKCRRMRDLTVFFTDIAGFTRLSESLPPWRMQELIEAYFSSFIDEIHDLGGTINETAGDGLMLLFFEGRPEDHARAAVQAASLIHNRTRKFELCHGDECRNLAVHIGVNSGRASLGVMEFRGSREIRSTYTASGPVTNIAARLAALAPAGKTYVGKETWNRIKESFAGNCVGRFELRNVGQPVEVYEVMSECPCGSR